MKGDYTRMAQIGPTQVRVGYLHRPVGTVSPVVNGKLALCQNAYEKWSGVLMRSSTDGPSPPQAASVGTLIVNNCPGLSQVRAAIDNELYGKARGRIRYGAASLGVALATWQQSAELIRTSAMKSVGLIDTVLHLCQESSPLGLKRARRRLMQGDLPNDSKELSNAWLAMQFGFAPLLSDIKSALNPVVHAIPPTYVGVRALRRHTASVTSQNNVYGKSVLGFEVTAKGSYVFQCSVSNPNLWLANYLGLIDVPGIIWDRVPWSFVLNMVSNASTLVGSITANAGLSVTGQALTHTYAGFITNDTTIYDPHRDVPGMKTSKTSQLMREKCTFRTTGVAPPLTFEWRVPHVDWGIATTAMALVGQRTSTLSNVLRLP